jgi:predicted sugar kinase
MDRSCRIGRQLGCVGKTIEDPNDLVKMTQVDRRKTAEAALREENGHDG